MPVGVSCTINLVDAEPTEEQVALFLGMVRAMSENPTEFMIFEFMNARNKPGQQQGLVFCQVCREDGRIHAEVRLDGPEEWRMYGTDLEEDEAAALLRQLIATRAAPELAGWEDITDRVFPDDGTV